MIQMIHILEDLTHEIQPPQKRLGGGFKYFLFSPRNLAAMMQFDLRIFFRWVGSTTN